MASFFCRSPWVGYTTAVSSTLPVPSTTATLQPIRYPGSNPMVTLPLTGGCIKRGLRFRANWPMAPSLALSVRVERASRSREGKIRRS